MRDRLPYRVEVDREKCMGSGVCTVVAPATFDIDEDAKAFVANPAGDHLGQIESAVAGCPTRAIAVLRTAEDG